MNIKVGYVFPIGKVKGRDPHTKRWFISAKMNSERFMVVLKDRFIPKGVKIKYAIELNNLVVIGHGEKYMHVALDGYLDELVRYYYHEPYLKKTRWRSWFKRWEAECAEQFVNNFSTEEIKHNAKNEMLSVFKLKGKDYVLPVFGYKDLNLLSSPSLFYPDIVKESGHINRSVYKTDSLNYFPRLYSAKVENGSFSKDVYVYLHGFTSPAKWHYGIWKHVFMGKAGSEFGEERELWEKIFKIKFPPTLHNIFNYCLPNKNDNSCDEAYCIDELLFRKIHIKIKDFCRIYLEQIVTAFELNTINIIKIFNVPHGNSVKIKLVFNYHVNGTHGKAIFKGICHNWNNNTYKPAIHLIPITFYLGSKPMSLYERDRNIPFLVGSLKEIKNAEN